MFSIHGGRIKFAAPQMQSTGCLRVAILVGRIFTIGRATIRPPRFSRRGHL